MDLRREDIAACREILRRGSRSFTAASRLLPRRIRDAASAVYAFCRVADDAIDGADASPAALDEPFSLALWAPFQRWRGSSPELS